MGAPQDLKGMGMLSIPSPPFIRIHEKDTSGFPWWNCFGLTRNYAFIMVKGCNW
jgi:hypothetical protein